VNYYASFHRELHDQQRRINSDERNGNTSFDGRRAKCKRRERDEHIVVPQKQRNALNLCYRHEAALAEAQIVGRDSRDHDVTGNA
jgi:hypothetical protein